jgi:hypothetical protein
VRTAVALMLALSAAACAGRDEATAKTKQWSEAITAFLAQPRKLDDLHPWLGERHVTYTFEQADVVNGSWHVMVEHIHAEDFFCEVRYIILTVQVSSAGDITGHSVSEEDQGLCR